MVDQMLKRKDMASVDVMNKSGEKVSETELPDDIFCVPVKNSVLHDMVRMQLVSRRRGTAKAMGRSEVSGSTRKLFRQKGPATHVPAVSNHRSAKAAVSFLDPPRNHGHSACLKKSRPWP